MTTSSRVAESRQPLWIAPAPMVIWGTHFMLCYITAALWCGMVAGREGDLSTARLLITAYTVGALAALALIGRIGYRAHTLGDAEPPHDDDTPEDRHRFIGFATLLLAGLGVLGVIYSALTVVFIETCQ